MAGHARSHSLTSRPLAALASTKGGEGRDRGAAPCPAGSRARERRRAVAALAPRLPSAAGFAALLGFAYGSLGHALMGATIGKRLLGLQVVGPDGVFPGLARSAARSGLAVLGTAGLGVGVLMALFTRSGRCL